MKEYVGIRLRMRVCMCAGKNTRGSSGVGLEVRQSVNMRVCTGEGWWAGREGEDRDVPTVLHTGSRDTRHMGLGAPLFLLFFGGLQFRVSFALLS